MTVPVFYGVMPFPKAFVDETFVRLRDTLDWVHRENTPRKEYYWNATGKPYTYGSREGRRTYDAQPLTPEIDCYRGHVEYLNDCQFEVCFLNRYDNERESLGWHADDSPEMDPARPIAIVSLGAEREIWFCPKDDKSQVTKMILQHGSVCIMMPGMQQTHLHRIPKSDRKMGTRISLTFRGYRKL